MNTKLLDKLKEDEDVLEILYEEDKVLAQKIETFMSELKTIMEQKLLLETKITEKDAEIERLKNNLVERLTTSYSIGLNSLSSIERDRLVLMMKSKNKTRIDEVLVKKANGVNFDRL